MRPLSPSSFGPCLAYLVLVLSGLPSGWGVHRHNDFPFDDRSRTTGDDRSVCVFCFCVCAALFCGTRRGGCCPHDDSASTSSLMLRLSFILDAFNKAWLPQQFCRSFSSSVLLGLVALFFFLLGWWGSPCRVFSSPLFLGSGWLGWGFLLALASCIFLSLLQLGQPGRPTRNPPGPHSPLSWRVPPHPSPAGSCRWDAPRQRAVG